MHAPNSKRPAAALRILGIAFLCWTVVAAFTTHVVYLYLPLTGQGRPPWLGVFLWSLPPAWLWALLTPAVIWAARRWRWDRTQPGIFLAVHSAGLAVLHVASVLAAWSLQPLLRPSAPVTPLAAALVDGVVFDAARYLVLVAGVHAMDFRSLYERQRREALELRSELLEAQLLMLRMRLQPHFLFNALHAISELVYRDAALADRAISRLADLLRGALASEVSERVTLASELEMADAYLDIERLRSGDALSVAYEVSGDTRGLAVPTLLLQPLIENALRHGLRGRARGLLVVGARRDGAALRLWVADDGAGLAAGASEGRGLRTTRARLRGLYGDEHSFALQPREGGGTMAIVVLPAQTHAEGGRS